MIPSCRKWRGRGGGEGLTSARKRWEGRRTVELPQSSEARGGLAVGVILVPPLSPPNRGVPKPPGVEGIEGEGELRKSPKLLFLTSILSIVALTDEIFAAPGGGVPVCEAGADNGGVETTTAGLGESVEVDGGRMT